MHYYVHGCSKYIGFLLPALCAPCSYLT